MEPTQLENPGLSRGENQPRDTSLIETGAVTGSVTGSEPTPAPSECPPSWPTTQAFADAMQVNRRRVFKWRQEGGPAGLDQASWLSWFRSTSRDVFVQRCPAPIAIQAPAMPAAPPAGADVTAADKKVFDAHAAREKAALLAIQRQEAEGRLIPVDTVARCLSSLATATIEVISDAVWLKQRPLLAGLSPDLIKNLRRAHDDGVRAVRERLAATARHLLDAIVKETL